jgi:hypothetical protein
MTLSEPIHEYLTTGIEGVPESVARGLCSKWGVALSLLPGQGQQLWNDHRDAILVDWLQARPGRRPWSWWSWDAREPRRVVSGAELLLPVIEPDDWAWVWRTTFGVPAFRQVRDVAAGDPRIESEAAYLARLDLLTPDERAALPADAFEPQTIAIPTKEWRPGACADSTSATRQ